MLKKYISKFTIDILPSVLATIIGAYIVNHYIVSKPDAPAAAVTSTPESTKAAGIPEAGVKAKGVSEKAMLEKRAAEGPAVADRPETASLPAESHRVQPAPHEKPAVRAQTAIPAPVAPAEAAAAPDEKRDATDLARAAIERLRSSPEGHAQEVARIPEAPRVSETPKGTSRPAAQPLPPPITVSVPASEASSPAAGLLPARPFSVQIDDPQRPTPPAEIPSSTRSLELRAEVTELPPRQRTSVAEDVLSAAKSVFHAVLPR
ncbi:MAG: hypothetical protein QOH32_2627 [Bradyrhizobium sp.]|jgi:hypothetical protein|nr:hypothetical protein [Bradyrhizobium sp.]